MCRVYTEEFFNRLDDTHLQRWKDAYKKNLDELKHNDRFSWMKDFWEEGLKLIESIIKKRGCDEL